MTAGQAGRRGGMALDFRRGRSAKERLQIAWTHPVWQPKAPAGGSAAPAGSTVAVEREHALPVEQAYAWIADGDRRPMIVLRECERCKGSDHALLSRTLDNEQTVLLTQWFRCVKLPTNVVGTDHPFAKLFQRSKPGEPMPHLFFCDADGGNKHELPGDQSQTELWALMFDFLDRCYDGDAKKSVKELRGLLSQFDRIDATEEQVSAKLDDELDKNGADSPKVAKYRADLEKLQAERKQLVAREEKLRALALASTAAAQPAANGSASK